MSAIVQKKRKGVPKASKPGDSSSSSKENNRSDKKILQFAVLGLETSMPEGGHAFRGPSGWLTGDGRGVNV